MDNVDLTLFLDVPHFGDLLNDSKYSLEDDSLFFSPRFDESEFDEAVKNWIDPGDSLSSYFQDEAEKKDESEEEVDIETVDDCAPLTANVETRQNFDRRCNGQLPLPAVDDVCDCEHSTDPFGDLINFSGIEADDLDSLMQQFDSAPNFQSPLLSSSVTPLPYLLLSPEPQQLPSTERSDGMHFVPTYLSTEINLKHAAEATLPVEKISDVALSVAPCGAESIEPYQLSADFFDKIPDHDYCLISMAEQLTVTGLEASEQSSTVDCSHSVAASVNHKYTAEPCSTSTYQMNDTANSAVAAALTSSRPEKCRDVKTDQSRSLLRPRTIAKSSATLPATSLQAAIVPAARSSAMCPSASRPSCSSSTNSRTGVELSSTATTSQSSCSDSGSESESGPRACRSSQSRPSRYRSRNRRGSNARDCLSPSSSSSSSCSTPGARSRSRSRSRVRSHSGRRRCEEEKRRAMTERRVVYVGNIPSNFKKADLRRCFSTFGEIEDVSVHFRDHGDNYGFVTFACPRNAVVAIEKGGNVQGRQFQLCFGGRRIFCETEYADLDGCAAAREEWALTQSRRRDDFESLLRQSMSRIKKD